jgi:hypothetical protein
MLSPATCRGQGSFSLGAMVLSLFGIRLARLMLVSSVSSSNLLLDQYCCLGNPALIWPHVAAGSLIAIPDVAISVALATLAHENRREILSRWTFLTFGLGIVACAGTILWKLSPSGFRVDRFRGSEDEPLPSRSIK